MLILYIFLITTYIVFPYQTQVIYFQHIFIEVTQLFYSYTLLLEENLYIRGYFLNLWLILWFKFNQNLLIFNILGTSGLGFVNKIYSEFPLGA